MILQISSLPGTFGIGDLGPGAYEFADRLGYAGQKLWQILPLNPVDESQGFSPYSSPSSFAGNLLLISPEKLAETGLLENKELEPFILPDTDSTHFKEALELRTGLLNRAFKNFSSGKNKEFETAFHSFTEQENSWLEDYALYCAAKKLHEGKPWYEWPEEYALREPAALKMLQKDMASYTRQVKFSQFIFHEQWKSLKKYCNERGIRIMGDLPFYISYDSADAWSQRELFKIDSRGKLMAVAGVPPDAFSETGQLWGMPVYNWVQHKNRNYVWWISRLKRNLELFDYLRLDHFRAFESYWEIDAKESTAKNGKWARGPGNDFFEKIKQAFPHLPFIAEDLGEITPEVYDLRDQFQLPGMKVLQFAFGENFNQSEHIPHLYDKNFIVYTGTHDNNTLAGWLKEEADEETLRRIEIYCGNKMGKEKMVDLLCRMAYASVANTVILPVQDLLQLDGKARMNRPSVPEGNWTWKLLPGQIKKEDWLKIREWSRLYNRD